VESVKVKLGRMTEHPGPPSFDITNNNGSLSQCITLYNHQLKLLKIVLMI